MPMIIFECNNPDCLNFIKKVFTTKTKIPPFLDCGECGVGKLERTLSAPSKKSTQIIDNGLQVRQVELMDVVMEKELERLNKE